MSPNLNLLDGYDDEDDDEDAVEHPIQSGSSTSSSATSLSSPDTHLQPSGSPPHSSSLCSNTKEPTSKTQSGTPKPVSAISCSALFHIAPRRGISASPSSPSQNDYSDHTVVSQKPSEVASATEDFEKDSEESGSPPDSPSGLFASEVWQTVGHASKSSLSLPAPITDSVETPSTSSASGLPSFADMCKPRNSTTILTSSAVHSVTDISPSIQSHYYLQQLRKTTIFKSLSHDSSCSLVSAKPSAAVASSESIASCSQKRVPIGREERSKDFSRLDPFSVLREPKKHRAESAGGFKGSAAVLSVDDETNALAEMTRREELHRILKRKELRELEQTGELPSIKADDLKDPKWCLPEATESGLSSLSDGSSGQRASTENRMWSAYDGYVVHAPQAGYMQKRKHQIGWLAHEAREKEFELLEQTRHTRQSKYQTAMKYGW